MNQAATIIPPQEDDVAALLAAAPGIATLAGLIAIDPRTLIPAARVDYLAALERQTSWLQAAMQRAIVAVAGIEATIADGPFGGVDESEREDVSSALRLSAGTAQMRIDVARTWSIIFLKHVQPLLLVRSVLPTPQLLLKRRPLLYAMD